MLALITTTQYSGLSALLKQLGIYCFLLWGLLCSPPGYAASQITQYKQPAEIYIIIDDMGYRATDALAFSLPKTVTFSILPHTPQGQSLAERAHAESRDVMLHLPMEANSDKPLGPGAITSLMYEDEITQTLESALTSVPHAIGVNNHMGSVLTASDQAMQTFMSAIKSTGLFFVDSRTTRFTVAQQVARDQNVPNARRHVFLDHEQNTDFMNAQWQRLLALTKHHQKVIVIAHPHPSTIDFLQRQLPSLSASQFTLKSMHDFFGGAVEHQQTLPELANSTYRSVAAPE